MKRKNFDDYYDFFQEIPQADYLNDIEIQDEYENTGDLSAPRGLSDEQVSQIALDSLADARRNQNNHEKPDQRPSQN